MKKVIFSMLFLMNAFAAFAQSPYFSTSNPLLTNPANTGLSSNANRLLAVYRNHYSNIGTFNTLSVSYDTKFTIGEKNKDKVGIGALILGDQAGTLNISNASLRLTSSYWKNIHKDGFMIVGGALGFVDQKMNTDGIWSEQYNNDNGGFDSNLASGEQSDFSNKSYFIFNSGLQYYFFNGENLVFTIGGSMNNINRPVTSFVDDDFRLNYEFVIHSSIFTRWIYFGQRTMSFSADIRYQQQAPFKMLFSRCRLGFDLGNDHEIAFGVGGKLTNSVNGDIVEVLIALLRVRKGVFILDITRDFTVNSNQPGKNAVDVSLQVLFGEERKSDKVICPF